MTAAPGTSGLRVFVVDDESLIASTLAAILCQSGYQARSFTNPLDALDLAREEAPHLLISDVVMPQMSGVELAVLLKSLCPDCKILLLSGQAGTLDFLAKAREQGHHFPLLHKPIPPRDLLDAIRRLE